MVVWVSTGSIKGVMGNEEERVETITPSSLWSISTSFGIVAAGVEAFMLSSIVVTRMGLLSDVAVLFRVIVYEPECLSLFTSLVSVCYHQGKTSLCSSHITCTHTYL